MAKRITVNDEDEDKYNKETYMSGELVGARLGVTRNLGDYNSLVIQFWHEGRVEDGESVDEATDRIYRGLEGRIEKAIEEYDEGDNEE